MNGRSHQILGECGRERGRFGSPLVSGHSWCTEGMSVWPWAAELGAALAQPAWTDELGGGGRRPVSSCRQLLELGQEDSHVCCPTGLF